MKKSKITTGIALFAGLTFSILNAEEITKVEIEKNVNSQNESINFQSSQNENSTNSQNENSNESNNLKNQNSNFQTQNELKNSQSENSTNSNSQNQNESNNLKNQNSNSQTESINFQSSQNENSTNSNYQNQNVEYIELGEEGMDRAEVQKFREMYLGAKWNKILCDDLERAVEYRLYVRNRILEEKMPSYLEYLPIVESNYRTSAKSSSGALGMWQFMENSVEPFLILDDFRDERLDPWKSTDAALKKLKENYDYFGNWLIAIAAYNCGTGAMSRIIKKSNLSKQEISFWKLLDSGLLPKQTANYIPKLLAVADLAINSEFYNANLPSHEEEFKYLYNEKHAIFDTITTDGAYLLSELAAALRIDEKEFKRLNPSFIKGMTHPVKKSEIRLPEGTKESAIHELSKMTKIDFPFKYKVVKGDSLWSISRKYKTTVSSICELNGINENDILKIGKILYIPSK